MNPVWTVPRYAGCEAKQEGRSKTAVWAVESSERPRNSRVCCRADKKGTEVHIPAFLVKWVVRLSSERRRGTRSWLDNQQLLVSRPCCARTQKAVRSSLEKD